MVSGNKFDKLKKDGMDKGQSINHIVETNKNMIRYSKSSVYRLVNANQTTIQRLDLRRAVKLRPRKHYVPQEDAKEVRNGRKYADFLKYVANKYLRQKMPYKFLQKRNLL